MCTSAKIAHFIKRSEGVSLTVESSVVGNSYLVFCLRELLLEVDDQIP